MVVGITCNPEVVDIQTIWTLYDKIPNLRFKIRKINNIKKEYQIALVTYNLETFWETIKTISAADLEAVAAVLEEIYISDMNLRWGDKNDVKHRLKEIRIMQDALKPSS
jgi:hypothetical protein